CRTFLDSPAVSEYCRTLEPFAPDPFAVEHITPSSKGGKTRLGNLASVCMACNGRKYNTEASRPFDETFPRIAVLIKKTIEAALRSRREALAISVSIGGPLKIAEGVLIDPPHLPGWRGVRLKERLADEFPNLPVFVEHDGNAGALAEFHFGV